ncbi:MAG TPA: hypothetical protein PK096_00815 [Candidatus Saccharibacteria bacterium]|nr:hypothetical protein [Candidatus Saccharibacteria bacterium]HRK93895.1 hypothetical protein [Candidatus Saccharibacteria bacterium]
MKSAGLNARKLRLLLLLSMIFIMVVAVVGFYFMQRQLHSYADSISHLNADAASGDQNLTTLRALQTQLDEKAGIISKTKAIVAESKQYVYQDQIIEDLTRIGQESGVTVTGFTFTSPAAADGTTPTATAPTAVSTLKSQKVTVSIASPLNYDNLMKFIKKIELNSMKMQISSVSITREKGSNVSSDSFTIEVYVR